MSKKNDLKYTFDLASFFLNYIENISSHYLSHFLTNKFLKSCPTFATSSWLSWLKCAVPTKYTLPPSGVCNNVTVSGSSWGSCRRDTRSGWARSWWSGCGCWRSRTVPSHSRDDDDTSPFAELVEESEGASLSPARNMMHHIDALAQNCSYFSALLVAMEVLQQGSFWVWARPVRAGVTQ